MAQILKHVLILSAAGSVLFLLLYCIKPVAVRIFGAAWQYYTYLCVLFIMLCPISVSLPARTVLPNSLIAVQNAADNAVRAAAANQTAEKETAEETQNGAEIHVPSGLSAKNAVNLAGAVWLIVALVIFGIKTARYALFLKVMRQNSSPFAVKTALPHRLAVRQTELLSAPLVAGLTKPALYLPGGIDEEELCCIVRHEVVHFKRGDLWAKQLALITKCVHWFNPLVYLLSREIDEMCEISCDESVSQKLCEGERRAYMKTILSLLQRGPDTRALPSAVRMIGGKRTMKRRFEMIKNAKPVGKARKVISVLLASVLVCTTVLAGGLLSGSVKESNAVYYEINTESGFVPFENEPIVYNGCYYLPLRETLGHFGITDISYAADETVTVKLSGAQKEGAPTVARIKIGGRTLFLQNPDWGKFMLTTPPVEVRDFTYVPLNFFEILMGAGYFPDFQLNAVRPTEPEAYYEKGEKVFIGTPAQQDEFSADEAVKRIITNKMGEVVAVVPLENQTEAGIHEKTDGSVGSYMTLNGFKQLESASYMYNARGEAVAQSQTFKVVSEISGSPIAVIIPADTVQPIDSAYSENVRPLVCNTYQKKTETALFVRPVSGGTVSTQFGSDHTGTDISVPKGTAVLAAADGVLETAEYSAAKGYYMVIDHQNGYKTEYRHLSELFFRAGETVRGGSEIALSGTTGMSTGPHLHFEILKDGKAVNPADFIK